MPAFQNQLSVSAAQGRKAIAVKNNQLGINAKQLTEARTRGVRDGEAAANRHLEAIKNDFLQAQSSGQTKITTSYGFGGEDLLDGNLFHAYRDAFRASYRFTVTAHFTNVEPIPGGVLTSSSGTSNHICLIEFPFALGFYQPEELASA